MSNNATASCQKYSQARAETCGLRSLLGIIWWYQSLSLRLSYFWNWIYCTASPFQSADSLSRTEVNNPLTNNNYLLSNTGSLIVYPICSTIFLIKRVFSAAVKSKRRISFEGPYIQCKCNLFRENIFFMNHEPQLSIPDNLIIWQCCLCKRNDKYQVCSWAKCTQVTSWSPNSAGLFFWYLFGRL